MNIVTVEPLTASKSWRGKLYPKGCTRIPEDLAIALGLVKKDEAEPLATIELESTTDPESVADLPPPPPPNSPSQSSAPKAKRRKESS